MPDLPAMEQYRAYLRAELGKLRNAADTRAFLASGTLSLESLGLKHDVDSLTGAFASQDQVDAYVDGLTERQLVDLTECCGRWRKNGVADKLRPRQRCELVSVPVDRVLLCKAERDLWHVFEELGWRLTDIARDERVLATDGYRGGPGFSIPFRPCLAKPEADGSALYRVFDGVHRAVQMFRDGEAQIPLCVVHDP